MHRKQLAEIYLCPVTMRGKGPGTPRAGYACVVSGWEKTDAKYGVSVQRGTPAVPDDGRYHVVVDGEIMLSTRVEALALAEFDEIREQRRAPAMERLQKERGEAAYLSMKDAMWDRKATRAVRKGGRVGRK